MKVGDNVILPGHPEFGKGKVIRFYANHGTVLVNFDKKKELTYCMYNMLISNKSEK